jgi:ornithine carbamoyltransferase
VKYSLSGRSLLSLRDYTPAEIAELIELAIALKAESAAGTRKQRLAGYSIALLFEKRSTRTRCAFETAFGEEGGHAVFLGSQDIHLGVKEDLEDTARVLGRMFDCIQFRGFKQETVDALAKHSGVPVYNGLTDLYHPTQALADIMTLQEACGTVSGTRLAYVGDGRNNVARSLMIICGKLGVNFVVGAPAELAPDEASLEYARGLAAESGGAITVETSPEAAVSAADAIYTDVWASMGEEAEAKKRAQLLQPYRVTSDLMAASGKASTIFLHCLPAVKGQEVTPEVFESAASRVFDQAENRKHTIKAVILASLGLA